ncbi:Geranylgeranyl transferase type-2 subunit alpha [Gryllus bimaculatus]|nr:Geranylgeranyl transferase type-2 subunit alpha [Gryllus bimaculatus]
MHGRVKTRSTAEQQEVKRKEREKKVKLYKAGVEKLFQKRDGNCFDNEVLEISAQLLCANPDIYTVWNIRRQVILYFKTEKSSEDFQLLLENELPLTEQCLRANPKSYCAWHHRSWVLDTMPVPNWKRELALCNKYLELDERNFHTWDYRRYIVTQAQVPAEDEFIFSTQKISTNFSNYSSWHYRSRLLPSLFPDPLNKRPIREDKHKEELSLVQNATFTDPNDQSAWFYQRWLLGRAHQSLLLVQAFVSEQLTFAVLNKSVRLDKSNLSLQLFISNNPIKGSWKPCGYNVDSHVWVSFETFDYYGGSLTSGSLEVTLHHQNKQIDQLNLHIKGPGVEAWGSKKPQFDAQFSQGLTSVLETELDSYHQLLDLEPDSKWTLLTIVLLMQAIDRHLYKDDTMQKIGQLKKIDPLRSGYYEDLRSRYEIEYFLDNQEKDGLSHPACVEVKLSGYNLSALYHLHYLSLMQQVNLSCNQLTDRSLPQLHALQCCQVLILDENLLESLNGMPSLTSLLSLSLKNNRISTKDNLKHLVMCQSLNSVHLSGNTVANDADLEVYLKGLLPKLKTEEVI